MAFTASSRPASVRDRAGRAVAGRAPGMVLLTNAARAAASPANSSGRAGPRAAASTRESGASS
jgi:hypothetical protein